jgi:transglutaminase-like putative cysteine protease
MLFRICHTTRFQYEGAAYHSQNELRMRPLDSPNQRCLDFELWIEPRASTLEYDDYYGNRVHAFSIETKHDSLNVVARSLVEQLPQLPDPPGRTPFREFLLNDGIRSQAEYDFLNASQYVPFSGAMRKFFWSIRPDLTEDVRAYTIRVVNFIWQQFQYEPGTTEVHSTADQILTEGAGVCQDFAHLTLGVLRLSGIPARYVSGYLAPMADTNLQSLGAQASHAWIEAQLPGLGWSGFDPTNGCRVDQRHVRVAIGRDYSDVPPLRGVYKSKSSRQIMTVDLRIEPASTVEPKPDPNLQAKMQNQQ